MGYYSNANCTRRFLYEDNNTYFIRGQPHFYCVWYCRWNLANEVTSTPQKQLAQ